MKIEFEGRVWDYDDDVTIRQAMVIQAHTGMPVAAWEKSLQIKDGAAPSEWPLSVQALWWLIRDQNGEKGPIGDADCKIGAFLGAYVQGLEAELAARKAAAGGRAADPTTAAVPPAAAEPVTAEASPGG